MPRIPRGELSAHAFHVLGRGNNRATVFNKDADYRAFVRLLAAAKERCPMRVFAFSLLPNHFHAVLQPTGTASLSRFMHWWLTSHVRRYHRHYGTSGHVWQGRFKSFPIQQDEHLLTVIRYVLLNPVRAHLAERAAQWPWSSLHHAELVDPWPVPAPAEWDDLLGQPLDHGTLEELRNSARRQTPFGEANWQAAVVRLGGMQATLRPRGRPQRAR
jgi:putative transposase